VFEFLIQNNAALTSLQGLESLNQVTGIFSIENNAALTSLQGLNNCHEIKDLYILFCPSLTNITSLEGLTRLGRLSIENCTALTSLHGLENVTEIAVEAENPRNSYGGINISGNPNLTSLQGLENCTYIRSIGIINNNGLTSLEGLHGLTKTTSIAISENNSLTSIEHLSSLTSIRSDARVWTGSSMPTGGLYITNNPMLTSLDGLENVTDFFGFVEVKDNTSLTDLCAAIFISHHISRESPFDFSQFSGNVNPYPYYDEDTQEYFGLTTGNCHM
jgi:hypothetical protein